jgi:hypothetical protein
MLASYVGGYERLADKGHGFVVRYEPVIHKFLSVVMARFSEIPYELDVFGPDASYVVDFIDVPIKFHNTYEIFRKKVGGPGLVQSPIFRIEICEIIYFFDFRIWIIVRLSYFAVIYVIAEIGVVEILIF